MIDSETGVIDQATWIDPGDDGISGISLPQLDQMFTDEANGTLPSDNLVQTPEPSTLALISVAATGMLGYTWRRSRPDSRSPLRPGEGQGVRAVQVDNRAREDDRPSP